MQVADPASSGNKSKKKKKSLPGLSAGIQLGLRLWILFLLGFSVLGTPVRLSILFSALAGFSAGTLAVWLKQAEAPEIAQPEPQPEAEPEGEPRSRLVAQRLKRQEKYLKRKQKQKQDRRLTFLGRLLKRRFASRRSRR